MTEYDEKIAGLFQAENESKERDALIEQACGVKLSAPLNGSAPPYDDRHLDVLVNYLFKG